MPSADYVFFENATSPLHREHIILHELGHLLRDHAPKEIIDNRVLRLLLPTLDIDVIRRVMGRTSYSAVEEQEAEMIASLSWIGWSSARRGEMSCRTRRSPL
jgi:hypothetical protein